MTDRAKVIKEMENSLKKWGSYPLPKKKVPVKVAKKPKRTLSGYLKGLMPAKSGTTMPSHINPKDRKWLKEELKR